MSCRHHLARAKQAAAAAAKQQKNIYKEDGERKHKNELSEICLEFFFVLHEEMQASERESESLQWLELCNSALVDERNFFFILFVNVKFVFMRAVSGYI